GCRRGRRGSPRGSPPRRRRKPPTRPRRRFERATARRRGGRRRPARRHARGSSYGGVSRIRPRSMGLSDADVLAIRRDFPPLSRRRNGKPPIYLNNTCMTLRPKSVVDAVRRYYEEFPTCGGGRTEGGQDQHNWFLGELKEQESAAREAVRGLVNAAVVDEMVWTRNTTEAMNIVSRGLRLRPGDRVLLS